MVLIMNNASNRANLQCLPKQGYLQKISNLLPSAVYDAHAISSIDSGWSSVLSAVDSGWSSALSAVDSWWSSVLSA